MDKHILSEILDDKFERFVVLLNDKIAGLEDELAKKSNDPLYTVDETKKLLKCDESTLYRWRNDGKIKAHAIGSRVYFKKSSIQEALIEIMPKKKRL